MLDRDPRRLRRLGRRRPRPRLLLRVVPRALATEPRRGPPPRLATIARASATRGGERRDRHVAGAVKQPGVYRLRRARASRTRSTAPAAPTRRADLSQLNRAAKLEDGRQILVPGAARSRAPRRRQPRRPATAPGGARPADQPQHRDARATRHARRRRPDHRPEDPRVPRRSTAASAPSTSSSRSPASARSASPPSASASASDRCAGATHARDGGAPPGHRVLARAGRRPAARGATVRLRRGRASSAALARRGGAGRPARAARAGGAVRAARGVAPRPAAAAAPSLDGGASRRCVRRTPASGARASCGRLDALEPAERPCVEPVAGAAGRPAVPARGGTRRGGGASVARAGARTAGGRGHRRRRAARSRRSAVYDAYQRAPQRPCGDRRATACAPTGARRGGLAGALDGVRRRAERGLDSGLAAPGGGAAARDGPRSRTSASTEEVRDDFQRSGLAHILAVCGQNVMLLAVLVLAAVRAGRRRRCGRGSSLAAALIAVYVPLAGGGPSIQRAGVMGVAGLVAALAGRPARRWYALLLAAAVTLALNPRAAGEPGWQLSFAAVVALLVGAAPLREALARADARRRSPRPPRSRSRRRSARRR